MRTLRVLPLWVAAITFFAATLFLTGRPTTGSHGLPPGSAFDESPRGLALAYRYLRGRPGGASILSRRIGRERLPDDAVVLRVHPERRQAPEEAEPVEEARKGARPRALLTPEEREWVERGGRLLLAVAEDYDPLRAGRLARPGPLLKVFPIWPGVRALEPKDQAMALAGPPAEDAVTLFARGSSPLVSRLALGKGDVLLTALPEVLENAALGRADHLRLLVAIAGEGRPVLFDEWAHGFDRRESLAGLLLEWGFGPALLLAALAFALWLWRGRARLGAPDRDSAQIRSEAVDLVDSLAQLYARALGRREAVRLYRDHFAKAVGLRTGLRGRALDQRVEELCGKDAARLRGGPEIPSAQFTRLMRSVNDGFRRLHQHADPHRRL